MKLQAKFNIVFLVVFAGLILLSGGLLYQKTLESAKAEVETVAGVLEASALAVRSYTVREVTPLLTPFMEDRFLEQSVSAYAAQKTLREIRERFPEYAQYSYREAVLNPTNLMDRATKWEADIIQAFRTDPSQREYRAIHVTPLGQFLVLAHPVRVIDTGCLTCHGRPEEAPSAMLRKYGPNNGFGWHVNEIIGAQIVAVPMAVPLERAWNTFTMFMGTLVAGFILIAVLLNILLRLLAVKPVSKISAMANEVSLGKLDAPEVEWNSRDEIGSLSRSFNRMRYSLESALRLLQER